MGQGVGSGTGDQGCTCGPKAAALRTRVLKECFSLLPRGDPAAHTGRRILPSAVKRHGVQARGGDWRLSTLGQELTGLEQNTAVTPRVQAPFHHPRVRFICECTKGYGRGEWGLSLTWTFALLARLHARSLAHVRTMTSTRKNVSMRPLNVSQL